MVENAFVVPLDLVELLAAEADSVAEVDLVSVACCALLLVEEKLSVELCMLELVALNEVTSLAEWFSEELMLDVDEFILVSFELLFTVSWLFCPRW